MYGYSYSLPLLSLTHSLTQPLSHPKCIKLQTTAAKQKFQPTQSTHPSGLAVRPVVTLTFCDTLTCCVVCRNADKSTFVLSLITLADQPHKYFFLFLFFFGFALAWVAISCRYFYIFDKRRVCKLQFNLSELV